MRVLITGSDGYLGKVLLKELEADKSMEAVGVDWGLYEIGKPLKNRGDFRKLNQVDDYDAVVHLAAIVGEPACSNYRELARDINYHGALHMIELADEAGIPLVFASTCSVYGAADEVLFEGSKTAPQGPYARDRLIAERAVRDKDGVSLRFGTLFGWSERMRFDLVVNQWAWEAYIKKPIEVHGGNQWRPFAHVRDAAGAVIHMLRLIQSGQRKKIKGKAFNVASVNTTILELANTFRKATGCEVEIAEKLVDMRNYKVSCDRLQGLGWRPKMTLNDGIKEILKELSNNKICPEGAKYSNLKSLEHRFPTNK